MTRRRIKMELEVEELNDPQSTEGHATLRIADCSVHFRQAGHEVGAVEGVIGGGVEMWDERARASGGRLGGSWYVRAADLWNAFQRALVAARVVDEPRLLPEQEPVGAVLDPELLPPPPDPLDSQG